MSNTNGSQMYGQEAVASSTVLVLDAEKEEIRITWRCALCDHWTESVIYSPDETLYCDDCDHDTTPMGVLTLDQMARTEEAHARWEQKYQEEYFPELTPLFGVTYSRVEGQPPILEVNGEEQDKWKVIALRLAFWWLMFIIGLAVGYLLIAPILLHK